MRAKLTYANVMSTIAVVLALTGGATAVAVGLGKGSVGPRELKKGAVRGQELGPVVMRKRTGPGVGQGIVRCNKGERVIGGGGIAAPTGGGTVSLTQSEPLPNGWAAAGTGASAAGATVTAFAMCLRR